MKHSLLALTLLSALTISHTITPMPSKTTMAGIACLTGAGILAAKHAKAISDGVVSGTKSLYKASTGLAKIVTYSAEHVVDFSVWETKRICNVLKNAIKNDTTETANDIKDWYKNNRYSDFKIGLGLVATGSFLLTPFKKSVIFTTAYIYYGMLRPIEALDEPGNIEKKTPKSGRLMQSIARFINAHLKDAIAIQKATDLKRRNS